MATYAPGAAAVILTFDALWVCLVAQTFVEVDNCRQKVDGGAVSEGILASNRQRTRDCRLALATSHVSKLHPPPVPAAFTHPPRYPPAASAKSVMFVMSRRSSVRVMPSTSALPRPCRQRRRGEVVGEAQTARHLAQQ